MLRTKFTAVAKQQCLAATRSLSLPARTNYPFINNGLTSVSTFKRYTAPAFTATSTTFSAASLITSAKPAEEEDSGKHTYAGHVLHHGDAESQDATKWKPEYGTLYQFKDLRDLSGNKFDFSKLEGKVVLMTNSACMCGYTKKAFEHLVAWKNKFANRPFEIVAFPSNSFNQEKGSAQEIKDYLSVFDVNFPLMETSDVNGPHQNPVFKWLKTTFKGPLTWNFSAYWLVDAQGKPIARFEKASWGEIEKAIEKAIEDAEKAKKSGENKQ